MFVCICVHAHTDRDIYTESSVLTFKNFYYSQAPISLHFLGILINSPTILPILCLHYLYGSFNLTFPFLSACLNPTYLWGPSSSATFPDSMAKSNFPLFKSLNVTNLVHCWGVLSLLLHFVVIFESASCLLYYRQWK